MDIKDLPLDKIRADLDTQMRIKTNDDTVQEYAEALERGDTFPPIIVFLIAGVYVLVDGFHRLAAYLRLGRDTIPCEIVQGKTLDDAREYACCANRTHGLARTPDDKRKAVITFFGIPDRDALSNSEIARRLGVTGPFVKKVRDELGVKPSPAAHHGKGSEKFQEERLNGLILKANVSENDAGLNGLIPSTKQDNDVTINVELPTGNKHRFAVALYEHFGQNLQYLKSCTDYLTTLLKESNYEKN